MKPGSYIVTRLTSIQVIYRVAQNLYYFFHSTSEPKGAECYEKFKEMQDCMQEYPTLYKEKNPMPDKSEVEAAEAASSPNASETAVEKKESDEQKKESPKAL